MDAAFEKVLIEALDALESGEAVETILGRYPNYVNELRPVLLTTSSLASMRVAHSLEAQAASRQQMLDYAAAAAAPPRRIVSPLVLLRRLSLAMAALLVIFGLLGSGVLFASSEAIPGDALYEAKRFFENTRLSLTGDSAASEALRQQYEESRIREIETLLRMGRSEEVEFTGVIVAIDGDTWVVAGLETVILDSTMVTGAGAPAIGSLVQITGLTTNGRVHALTVVVRSIGSVPEPEDDSTKTPAPEPSPTNTPTPSPTATNTPTPTTTPTSEEGSSEAPPAPSATPTLESNENGNANGNENHGGGNSNENGEEPGGNNSGSNENDDDDEGNENEHNENESNDNGDNDNEHEEENENGSNDNENRNENKS
jgi:hypothetical protein